MIIDVETYPFKVGDMLPRIVCLQWCNDNGAVGIYKRDDARRFLTEVLSAGCNIIGHNVAYDLCCAMTNWPELVPAIIAAYDQDRVRDTMLWDKLWHVARGLRLNKRPKGYWGLAAGCERYGIHPPDKDSEWRTRYHELDAVSLSDWPADALQYALYDAACTKAYADKLPDIPDVTAQARWDCWLRLSSAYGMKTDQPKVHRWAARLTAERQRIGGQLQSLGLVRENGTRDDGAIRARVLDALGDAAPRTKPSGRFPNGQVKKDAQTCRDSGDAVLLDYAEYASICGALDREYPMLQAPYVHTYYAMAASGRSTSSKQDSGAGGNLQNMTKASGSRGCFGPRPGNVYCIIDFSGLELSTLGQLCVVMGAGDKLANAIREGRDAHGELAAEIMGIPHEQFDRSIKEHYDWRDAAKDANFGYPGGAGWRAFQASIKHRKGKHINDSLAKRLRNAWRRKWTDAVRYQKIVDKWLNGACLQCSVPTLAGTECPQCGGQVGCGILQHYRSNRIRGGLIYTSGCNTLFQGLGGDVTKDAGWRLTKAGYAIVAFVHDEYVIEVPREHAIEAAYDIQRICEDTAREWLPDAPSRAEPVLATRWTKADPLVVDGRLTVIDVIDVQ